MLLKGGKVLTDKFVFQNANLETENGKIKQITTTEPASDNILDCSGCYVVPGFIDVHTHGCLGKEYGEDAKTTVEMCEYIKNSGTTSFLPTFSTISKEEIVQYSKNVLEASKNNKNGAKILGIHMEGPFFSMKYKGAQNPEYIRKPDINEFNAANEASNNMVKLISVAPELEGAYEFIKEASKRATVAIGHTDADYEIAKEAINCGATQITHTFNAMQGIHHRNPGVIGAAFESDNVYCECICDGMHIHPSIVRLLFSAAGEERAVIITDAISAAGLEPGKYFSCGLEITVENGLAKLSDGTIAGSTATMIGCVKNVISFGIAPEIAFKAASLNPAKAIKMDHRVGSLAKGKDADILVLDKDYNIKYVIIDGEIK
ncbi:MAG: N-acetylglucosamine-6-phosphate deacetylase [Clostridia bacterium]|nr:N-acetylglucosamine-6-phosphate deacetylase [Clostridia bacterium]